MAKSLQLIAVFRAALVCAVFNGAPLYATQNASEISDLCERAALTASRASGVPLNVLRAISLTETGRAQKGETQPWPWTVNMEGLGKWFDNREEALAYVLQHHSRGARSYDVGCFQINFRWHGDAFASIEDMFDPESNALYAARFLSDLFDEFGDWSKAAGAYHSRTPKYAKRYQARFSRFLTALGPAPTFVAVEAPEPLPKPAPNLFPLLVRSNERASVASLVPLGGTGGRRLIDMSGQ